MTTSTLLSMLTDYAIALEALLGAIALGVIRQRSVRSWAFGFLAIALAAAGGGTVHGFADVLPYEFALLLWKATLYSLGLASMLLLLGTAIAVPPPLRTWVGTLAGLKAACYFAIVARQNSFVTVIIDQFMTLGGLVLILITRPHPQGATSLPWVGAGGAIALLATGLLSRGDLAAGQSTEGIYHLVQMGTLYCLYRGGRLLKDG